MRKPMQKLISIFTALIIMCASVLPAAVFAAETTLVPEEQFERGEGVGMLEDFSSIPRFYGINGSYFLNDYYDQLDDESKAAYDTIYKEYNDCAKADIINLPLTKVFKNKTVTRSGNTVNISSADRSEISEWIIDAVRPAIMALLYDHPELSWLINAAYVYSWSAEGFSFPAGVTTITADINVKSVRFGFSDVYMDTGDKADMDSALANAKAEIDASINADDERTVLKAVHDYICRTVTYTSDSDLSKRLYQTPYSAFYGNKETVCAGYSKAFKLLCGKYGIPCIIVSGTGNGGAHMWNYVKINDSWYAVDTTWDDQYIIFYDFFLCGSDTVAENISSGTFSSNHIPDGMWSGNAKYVFAYPDLSSEAYAPHIHDIIFNDKTAPTPDSNGVKSHYICTSCGILFADPQGKTEISESELVLVYCDVNGDGRVKANDLFYLRKIISGEYEENDNSDVTNDGRVTSRDITLLRVHISGDN